MQKQRLRGQNFFRHFSDALPFDFVEHTDSSMFEACDNLAAQKRDGIPDARFKELEQELGRNFVPSGIMYDSTLRREGQPISEPLYTLRQTARQTMPLAAMAFARPVTFVLPDVWRVGLLKGSVPTSES